MDNQISNENIGKRVAQLRKQQKLTQAQLADQIKTTSKHISEIERGVTGMSIDTQVLLAEKLRCSIDYMIKGEEYKSVESLLPDEITAILRSQNEKEIERLTRYLQIYVELKKERE